MTEADWTSCTVPAAMLAFLRTSGRPSRRKLRLFGVACCRSVWHLLTIERARRAVEALERRADGLAPEHAIGCWKKAYTTGYLDQALLVRTVIDVGSNAADHDTWKAAAAVARMASSFVGQVAAAAVAPSATDYPRSRPREEQPADTAERKRQAALLRDLLGNPFRPTPSLDPAWLEWNDGTVHRLATAIYEERAFGDLPILADALEEAGCGNPDMIGHCRQQETVHVRGCWLLDLLLKRA
jgi:hypothetical protein